MSRRDVEKKPEAVSLKVDWGQEDTSSLTVCSPAMMATRPDCRHTPGGGRGEGREGGKTGGGKTGRRETKERGCKEGGRRRGIMEGGRGGRRNRMKGGGETG